MTAGTNDRISLEELRTLPGNGVGLLAHAMGIVLTELGPERTAATMPVEGNTQPYGLLHGGASVVLAETVGSIAAAMHAGRGRMAMGVDINATHHRSMRTGTLTGVAVPAFLGRSSATYDILVTDEQGRRICTARLTCALRDVPSDAAVTGGGAAPTG